MSDNGMHYHCTELMLIIRQWKEWYNIIPRRWIFLEAGEAKTVIDSHYAQVHLAMLLSWKSKIILIDQIHWYDKVSQVIKRYIKLEYDIDSGDDIESAVKDIAGVRVSNLNPNRNNGKVTLISMLLNLRMNLIILIFIILFR